MVICDADGYEIHLTFQLGWERGNYVYIIAVCYTLQHC